MNESMCKYDIVGVIKVLDVCVGKDREVKL